MEKHIYGGRLEELAETVRTRKILNADKTEVWTELKSIYSKFKDLKAKGYLLVWEFLEPFHDGENLEKAYRMACELKQIGETCKDSFLQYKAYNYLGAIYDMIGDSLTAFDYFWQGILIIRKYGVEKGASAEELISIGFMEIAICLLSAGEYEKALEFYESEKKKKNEDELQPFQLEIDFANYINCYYHLKRYEEAFQILDRWKELESVCGGKLSLKGTRIIWEYILKGINNRTEDSDKLFEEILKFDFTGDIREELQYLAEFLLDTKRYREFETVIRKYEAAMKKQNNIRQQLTAVHLKLKYLEEFDRMEEYQEYCVIYHKLQKEIEAEEKNIRVSSLKTYVQIIEKEEKHIKLKKEKEVLQEKSEHDELTRLPNRYKLHDFCEELFKTAKNENKPVAVEILDVDYLKQYNDNYGHQQGDICLKMVADEIRQSLCGRDFAARYGGDEFIIIRMGCVDWEVLEKMNALRKRIIDCGLRHEYSEISSVVTVSQGAVNRVPKDGEQLKDFFELADKALYEAKANSKNTVVLYQATPDESS